MHRTNLRKVGGSVMVAVPTELLNILNLGPGSEVGIGIEGGRLVMEPRQRPRYTLNELLAQCDPRAKRTKPEQEWLDNSPMGRELI